MAIHNPNGIFSLTSPLCSTCVTSWPHGPLDSQVPLSTYSELYFCR